MATLCFIQNLLNCSCLHNIVATEKPAIIAASEIDGARHIMIDAPAYVLTDIIDRQAPIDEGAHNLSGVISRAPVQNDDLDAGSELPYYRIQRLRDEGAEVVGGYT